MATPFVIARETEPSRRAAAVFVIHSWAHAVAALTAAAETDRSIILLSAINAGLYAGAGWFTAMIAAARAVVPTARATAILDCGDDAGAAQAAIRAGIECIVFTGRPDVAVRLVDIARQRGACLLTQRPPVGLDLQQAFFADTDTLLRQCRAALHDEC